METKELAYILEIEDRLNSKLDSLFREIEHIKTSIEPPQPNNKELYTALAKAQGEMDVADLNAENKYYKSPYADLESVVSASRPALSKHGLSVTQEPKVNDKGQTYIDTVLHHSSGQSISCRMFLHPPKTDIQTVHSYTQYVKRICYASLVGVICRGEDDDAESVMAHHRSTMKEGAPLNNKYNPREQDYNKITKEQLDELEYELSEYPDIAEDILESFRLQSLSDMPKNKFFTSLKRIREIKRARNGQ